MSYQYPQYPQYPQQPPQFGQQPPAGQAPGSGAFPPPQGDPVPPGSVYVPINSTATWAEVHSQQLSNIAAGNSAPQFGVLIPPDASGSAQYPFLMYNQKDGTTKAAKDEKEKGELAGKGFGENPPPPDPNAITPEMLQALQAVWVKAGEELKRLTQLVDQQQKQMDAANAALSAGQQQQDPSLFQQQQYPQYPQTGD